MKQNIYQTVIREILARLGENPRRWHIIIKHFKKEHPYCPYGFDVYVNMTTKAIRLDVCANCNILDSSMRNVLAEEIKNHFTGGIQYAPAGLRILSKLR